MSDVTPTPAPSVASTTEATVSAPAPVKKSFSDFLKEVETERSAVAEEPRPEFSETTSEEEDASLGDETLSKDVSETEEASEAAATDPEVELKTKLETLEAEHKARTEELDTIKSHVSQLADALKTNPGEVLDYLDVPRELIETWYHEKYIKPELMTAEEKLAVYQKKEQEQKAAALRARQEQENAKRVQLAQEHLNRQITEALKVSGLPETDWTVSRMASYLRAAQEQGVPMDPATVSAKVKEDLSALQASVLKSLPPDKLVQQLGEDVVAKIRSHELNKVRRGSKLAAGEENAQAVTRGSSKQTESKAPKYRSAAEVMDAIRNLKMP